MHINANVIQVFGQLQNLADVCRYWSVFSGARNFPHNLLKTQNFPLHRKQTSDLPTSSRFSNGPMTCVMLAGLIQKIFSKSTLAENLTVTCQRQKGYSCSTLLGNKNDRNRGFPIFRLRWQFLIQGKMSKKWGIFILFPSTSTTTYRIVQ